MCGIPPEGVEEPAADDLWPEFSGATAQCLTGLTQLKELSLRHFRNVHVADTLPPSLTSLNLEARRPWRPGMPHASAWLSRSPCVIWPRPRPCPTALSPACRALQCLRPCPHEPNPWYVRVVGGFRPAEEPGDCFDFSLPPLAPGQQRTLHLQASRVLRCLVGWPEVVPTCPRGGMHAPALSACPTTPRVGSHPPSPAWPRSLPQFHRNLEYPVQRPILRLSQVMHTATRLIVTASADPLPPEDGEEQDEAALAAAAAAQRCASRPAPAD